MRIQIKGLSLCHMKVCLPINGGDWAYYYRRVLIMGRIRTSRSPHQIRGQFEAMLLLARSQQGHIQLTYMQKKPYYAVSVDSGNEYGLAISQRGYVTEIFAGSGHQELESNVKMAPDELRNLVDAALESVERRLERWEQEPKIRIET